ncbi:hypothetical protein BaRGS_00000534 [Batillaria attramentaria]|uniref:Uncharacterized protein n=1 Tax=Batillaria attramentaria TaxID=370345 RepID=A0ABD0M8P3_9CAEN
MFLPLFDACRCHHEASSSWTSHCPYQASHLVSHSSGGRLLFLGWICLWRRYLYKQSFGTTVKACLAQIHSTGDRSFVSSLLHSDRDEIFAPTDLRTASRLHWMFSQAVTLCDANQLPAKLTCDVDVALERSRLQIGPALCCINVTGQKPESHFGDQNRIETTAQCRGRRKACIYIDKDST